MAAEPSEACPSLTVASTEIKLGSHGISEMRVKIIGHRISCLKNTSVSASWFSSVYKEEAEP
jgi:hypothetical protein